MNYHPEHIFVLECLVLGWTYSENDPNNDWAFYDIDENETEFTISEEQVLKDLAKNGDVTFVTNEINGYQYYYMTVDQIYNHRHLLGEGGVMIGPIHITKDGMKDYSVKKEV